MYQPSRLPLVECRVNPVPTGILGYQLEELPFEHAKTVVVPVCSGGVGHHVARPASYSTSAVDLPVQEHRSADTLREGQEDGIAGFRRGATIDLRGEGERHVIVDRDRDAKAVAE